MKVIKLFFLSILLLSFSKTFAVDYYMSSPVGYGASTTGGGTSSTVTTVSSLSAFQTACEKSGSGIILVSGTITFTELYKVKMTNKTIIGLPGATFQNLQTSSNGITTESLAKSNTGILYLQEGSSNVIIRNITFMGPGAWDCEGNDGLCIDGGDAGCSNIWVDHCDFQDGVDGNFDIKGPADNISITWCKFSYNKSTTAAASWAKSGGTADHRFSDLIGSSETDKPTNRRITFAYCWWGTGCVERMPRSRHSQFHLLNCYWSSTSAKVNLGLGGVKAYIEGCYFVSKKSVIYKDYSSNDNATGNSLSFVNCIGSSDGVPSNETSLGTLSAPTYTYTALSAADAVTAVTSTSCGSGATLTVTSTGAISSPCDGPTLTLTSGSNTQTLYTGNAITNIVYTYGGTATGVTLTGTLPTGVDTTTNKTAKTFTISGTPTTAGTYNYTVTTKQSTGTAASLSGTINTSVQQPGTLSLTSGSSTQTAYVGTAISNIVYTYGGGATGVTVTGLPTGVSAKTNTTTKTVTISGTPTATNTGSYSIVTVGGSTNATLTGTITASNPTALSTPSNINASATKSSISLSWDAVSNASKYAISLCSSGSSTGDNVLFNETFANQTATSDSLSGSTFSYDKTWTIQTGTVYFTDVNAITLNGGCRITSQDVDLRDTNTVIEFDAKYMSGYTPVGGNVSAVCINDGTSTNSGLRFTVASDLSINLSISNGTGKPEILGATTLTSSYQKFKVRLNGYYVSSALDGTDHISIRTQSKTFIPLTIKNIKIYIPDVTSSSTTCQEDTVSGTSYTFTELSSNTTYTYQVKAISSGAAYTSGSYSTEESITTNGTTTQIANETASGLKLTQTNNDITASGIDVDKMTILNISGNKMASAKGNSINISSLTDGFYVVIVNATDGSVVSKKFVKY